jgi:hypothetical protein
MDGSEEEVFSSLLDLILSARIDQVVASSKVAELVKNRERKCQRRETSRNEHSNMARILGVTQFSQRAKKRPLSLETRIVRIRNDTDVYFQRQVFA